MTERATDFGSKMKRAREERGVTLRQIATATKISVSALEAIERNDISRLPGGIFSRGIVRSYATEVGLDPEATIREFLSQFPHDSVTQGSPHVPQEDHAAIESNRESAMTLLKLLGISVPVAGLLIYLTLTYRPRQAEPEPAKPAAAAASTEPRAAETAGVAGTAADLSAEPSRNAGTGDVLPVGAEPLAFEIVAKSPITIDLEVDGGVRRESRSVAVGEQVTVKADREMTLKVSDASAVQLTINGQPAVSLGSTKEPRTIQIGRENVGSFLASQ